MKKLFYLFVIFSSFINAQIVNIPDANFKAKLLQADVTNEIAYGNNSFIKIDSNNNGEIEVPEALQVTKLFVNFSQILDIEGIQSFAYLTHLDCSQNSIVSLNINSMNALVYLNCSNNAILSIDLSQNTSLVELYCNINQISALDVHLNVNLQRIDCSVNSISSLDVSNNSSLTHLNCSSNNFISVLNLTQNANLIELMCIENQISTLDLSQNPSLEVVSCFNNQISNLNVSWCSNLKILECYANQLSSIDVSQNTMLEELHCSNNQLISLNVSQATLLTKLTCGANQISTIDLSSNSALVTLDCQYNQIASIDVQQNTFLQVLRCDNNSITNLDLAQNTLLAQLYCKNNQLANLNLSANVELTNLDCSYNSLTSLDISPLKSVVNVNCEHNQITHFFAKNGLLPTVLNFQNNPIQYICCDEEDINAFQQASITNGMSCEVNSYCSFIPGGDYNTISGFMTFDADNNGCDTNDTQQPNIKIKINNGVNQVASFTSQIGNYNFFTSTGNFTLTPSIENQSLFTFSPESVTIPFLDNNNNVATQNFCITANGVHPDVEIVVAPIKPVRPDFESEFIIVFKNKGNQTTSGVINFIYNDSVLDYVAATTVPDAQNNGILSWNYSDLLPFENRSIYVTLNVSSSQQTAVVVGDVLTFDVNIISEQGDDFLEDNNFIFKQIVVDAYELNNIICLQGEVVPTSEIGEFLHYIINFENTGTGMTENIVLDMQIDPAKFDIDSLQILNASHDVYIRQKGNKAEFIFQEINMDTGGHGNVLLKIKTKNNLLEGDTVAKQANIYFDYNAPIETNLANTTFEILSNGNFEIDESITIFPNPTASIININCNNSIKTVELYDVQGRLLQTQIVDNATTSLDISSKTNGIYFAKITSENGVKVEKISKE